MRWEIYAREDAKEVFAKLYSVILIGLMSSYFVTVSAGTILGTFMSRNPEFTEGLRVTPLISY